LSTMFYCMRNGGEHASNVECRLQKG
jgi:hypothetical protein